MSYENQEAQTLPLQSGNAEKDASLSVAEAARETVWERPSFAANLFMGRVRASLVFPYRRQSEEDRRVGDAYLAKVESFLRENLDPAEVDRTREIPPKVIQGLVALGCFGMKIPKEYGGLGFSQVNYNRTVSLVASYCGSTAVWLSAHQSIGAPQPLKLFGTDEQKKKYLPRLATGSISAFALTEPDVGSDPARMSTTATPTDDGKSYLLNGQKLWCTNGPVADVIVVMACTPSKFIAGKERKQITAFIVERNWPGVEVMHRCDFMGIRGIQNGLLRFKDVRVPKENMLWAPGRGLKLALMTLNVGRLTMPAGCCGVAKWCLAVTRRWAGERKQWGAPIGHHEAVASKIGWMASHLFAMEAVTWLTSAWADTGELDIRIEAAMAKLFCTEAGWRIVDETLQIRGGRGFERGESLRARGEPAIPIEQVMRDYRINMIIEGSSEIMRLFIAREALDPHLQKAGDLINPHLPLGRRLQALLKAGLFYAGWYPTRWLPLAATGYGPLPGRLKRHMRYVERASRRLSRALFHCMVLNGPALERRQGLLFRVVDIGTELFAMSAACARAQMLIRQGQADGAEELADLFCRLSRRRVEDAFHKIWSHDDRSSYRLARQVLDGRFRWLEEGIIPPDATSG